MDTIFKTFRADVKDINEEDGSLNLFIPVSTDSVDRDGEVVEPLAFKKTLPKFMKRPVLVASHDYRDLTSQIGEWTKLKITEGGIEGKPKYYVGQGNEQADWGFKLASKGMAAFSIGFIPKVWEDGDGVKSPRRTYKEVELLEISQVIVPSNREAIQSIRSKSVDPIVTELCDAVEKEIPQETDAISYTEGLLDGRKQGRKEVVTKPEITDEYIRIPVDTGNHEGHRIRTIDISEKEGIKAIYCGTDKVIMTYLFAKDKGWTMAKAKKWVADHSKGFEVIETIKDLNEIPQKKEVSQAEILDELDYLIRLIDTKGMNDEVKKDVWNLVGELLRCCGNDIPLFIREMITPKQPEKEAKPELSIDKVQEIISKEIEKQIRKAQGALD